MCFFCVFGKTIDYDEHLLHKRNFRKKKTKRGMKRLRASERMNEKKIVKKNLCVKPNKGNTKVNDSYSYSHIYTYCISTHMHTLHITLCVCGKLQSRKMCCCTQTPVERTKGKGLLVLTK